MIVDNQFEIPETFTDYQWTTHDSYVTNIDVKRVNEQKHKTQPQFDEKTVKNMGNQSPGPGSVISMYM